MGYSIMSVFSNENERETMIKFLDENYKTLKDLTKDIGLRNFRIEDCGYPTIDIAYGSNKKEIILGFDYGASNTDEEREYFFSLCYWMAIHSKERKPIGRLEKLPYVIYDGVEEWILFVGKERDKKIESVEVDEYGFRESIQLKIMKSKKTSTSLFKKEIKELELLDEVIRKELQRLTKLWAAR